MSFKYLYPISFIFIFGLVQIQTAEAQQLSENDKIQYLIADIEALDDAVIIRNGVSHTPQKAADHLRVKLHRGRKSIQTAEDFIVHIASRSSMTRRNYIIQFNDGRTVESGIYLQEKLAELEGTRHANSDPLF